jgi:glycosyltransferase involved in cell wall biosynthesis
MNAIDRGTKSVAFVTRVVPHYRVEFLNGLEDRLKTASAKLTVFADNAIPQSNYSDALADVQCAVSVPNYYFGLRDVLAKRYSRSGGAALRPPYYQPILRRLLSFDLVIVEQSNSALVNYPLILHRRLLGSPQIAYWGHGKNLQASESGWRRHLKEALTHQADHWFVFTEFSAAILREAGVDEGIVTTVNNSISTTDVKKASALDAAAKDRKKSELGLGDAPVAVFCARLSQNKALPFLVDSCRAAREKFGDFTLLVIGEGHYGPWLREQAKTQTWIRPLGSLYGRDKAEALALSDIFLLPSANGLSILDGFAAGLPLLSARFGNHGPEIAYLKDGVNGILTDATVAAYSTAIVRLLSDEELRKRLSAAARQSADVYSVGGMIENFAQGIEQALAQPDAVAARSRISRT